VADEKEKENSIVGFSHSRRQLLMCKGQFLKWGMAIGFSLMLGGWDGSADGDEMVYISNSDADSVFFSLTQTYGKHSSRSPGPAWRRRDRLSQPLR
jgi:hypothetical protein